ncbi:hypothetical protein CXG81DRAFT_23631 [Caulochytrium protostelioides]|uniref:Bromo domain-containing protein n=1 Tax=Caulochytrium protostelioides TaxID=1555241 RepID=A0A4P9XE38_9FUNG|nr:hypothetical protein CXG81DRAFT_23631 [Caulochytrium protostelioides]|eukprot:RKP03795.1 hypothetical protein CXG81DRAFT_23631 [Caulochytrium protostelioides]
MPPPADAAALQQDRELLYLVLRYLASSPFTSAYHELRDQIQQRQLVHGDAGDDAGGDAGSGAGSGAAPSLPGALVSRPPSGFAQQLPVRIDWQGRQHTATEQDLAWLQPTVHGQSLRDLVTEHLAAHDSLLNPPRLAPPTGPLPRPRSLAHSVACASARADGIGWPSPMHALIYRSQHLLPRRDRVPPLSFYQSFQRATSVCGHCAPIYCMVFDATSQRFITGGDDNLIKIWCAETGWLLHSIRGHPTLTSTNQQGVILDLALTVDNTILASASSDRSIRMWDMKTYQPLPWKITITKGINTIRFSPSPLAENACLAVTCADGKVRLYHYLPDVDAYQMTADLVDAGLRTRDAVRDVDFDFTGTRMASGGDDGCLYIWSMIPTHALGLPSRAQPSLRARIDAHKGQIGDVVFSNRGDRILTDGRDGTVKLWHDHPQKGWCLDKVLLNAQDAATPGSAVHAAVHAAAVPKTEAPPAVPVAMGLPPAPYATDDMAEDRDAIDAADADADADVVVPETRGARPSDAATPAPPPALVASAAAGAAVAATATLRSTAASPVTATAAVAEPLADAGAGAGAGAGTALTALLDIEGDGGEPPVAPTPVGAMASPTVSDAGGAAALEINSSRVVVPSPAAEGRLEANGVLWTHDDRYALASTTQHHVYVWDASSGETVFVAHTGTEIYGTQCSPLDPLVFLTAEHDGTVTFWHIGLRRAIHAFRGHPGTMSTLISPNGELVLLGDDCGRVSLFACHGRHAPAYAQLPHFQFFRTDFVMVRNDAHGVLIDDQTHEPAHTVDLGPLLDQNQIVLARQPGPDIPGRHPEHLPPLLRRGHSLRDHPHRHHPATLAWRQIQQEREAAIWEKHAHLAKEAALPAAQFDRLDLLRHKRASGSAARLADARQSPATAAGGAAAATAAAAAAATAAATHNGGGTAETSTSFTENTNGRTSRSEPLNPTRASPRRRTPAPEILTMDMLAALPVSSGDEWQADDVSDDDDASTPTTTSTSRGSFSDGDDGSPFAAHAGHSRSGGGGGRSSSRSRHQASASLSGTPSGAATRRRSRPAAILDDPLAAEYIDTSDSDYDGDGDGDRPGPSTASRTRKRKRHRSAGGSSSHGTHRSRHTHASSSRGGRSAGGRGRDEDDDDDEDGDFEDGEPRLATRSSSRSRRDPDTVAPPPRRSTSRGSPERGRASAMRSTSRGRGRLLRDDDDDDDELDDIEAMMRPSRRRRRTDPPLTASESDGRRRPRRGMRRLSESDSGSDADAAAPPSVAPSPATSTAAGDSTPESPAWGDDGADVSGGARARTALRRGSHLAATSTTPPRPPRPSPPANGRLRRASTSPSRYTTVSVPAAGSSRSSRPLRIHASAAATAASSAAAASASSAVAGAASKRKGKAPLLPPTPPTPFTTDAPNPWVAQVDGASPTLSYLPQLGDVVIYLLAGHQEYLAQPAVQRLGTPELLAPPPMDALHCTEYLIGRIRALKFYGVGRQATASGHRQLAYAATIDLMELPAAIASAPTAAEWRQQLIALDPRHLRPRRAAATANGHPTDAAAAAAPPAWSDKGKGKAAIDHTELSTARSTRGSSSSAAAASSSSLPTSITLHVMDAEETQEFVLPLQRFQTSLWHAYGPGSRIEAWFGDTRWEGVVRSAQYDAFARRVGWKTLQIGWPSNPDDPDEWMSPWEVQPLDVPAAPLPPHLQAHGLAHPRIIRKAIDRFAKLPEMAPFCEDVPYVAFPDYLDTIVYPVSMATITARLDHGFYRDYRSVLWDVALIRKNAMAYNQPHSEIWVTAKMRLAELEQAIETSYRAREPDDAAWQAALPGVSDDEAPHAVASAVKEDVVDAGEVAPSPVVATQPVTRRPRRLIPEDDDDADDDDRDDDGAPTSLSAPRGSSASRSRFRTRVKAEDDDDGDANDDDDDDGNDDGPTFALFPDDDDDDDDFGASSSRKSAARRARPPAASRSSRESRRHAAATSAGSDDAYDDASEHVVASGRVSSATHDYRPTRRPRSTHSMAF